MRQLFRKSVVTDWGRNPFCRGSYSYVGVDASGAEYDELARPVGGRLFFAGVGIAERCRERERERAPRGAALRCGRDLAERDVPREGAGRRLFVAVSLRARGGANGPWPRLSRD